MKNKLTYSINESAELLGVSPGLLYTEVRKGNIRSIRLGRKIVIPRPVIEEILGFSLGEQA